MGASLPMKLALTKPYSRIRLFGYFLLPYPFQPTSLASYFSAKSTQLLLLVFLLTVLQPLQAAKGSVFAFTKIADTNTAIPGGGGNFTQWGAFSLNGCKMAFGASGLNREGVYLYDNGSLATIVDTSSLIPEGTGNFMHFGHVSYDNGNLAMKGGGENQSGIYLHTEGSLQRFVDLNTPIPEGMGNFTHIDEPSFDMGAVAFSGADTDSQLGIHTANSGTITKMADTNTASPDGLGDFTSISACSSLYDAGHVAFEGRGVDQEGGYANSGGEIIGVADQKHHHAWKC